MRNACQQIFNTSSNIANAKIKKLPSKLNMKQYTDTTNKANVAR